MRIHTVELPLGEPGRHEVVLLTDHGQALAKMLAQRDTAQAQLAEAVGLGKALHSACVNLLYGGYDRITEIGGDCDPVSKMEAENPAMQEWKAFLARHAQAEQQEAKPATFYDAIKNPPRIAPTLQQEARAALATQPAVRGAEHDQ